MSAITCAQCGGERFQEHGSLSYVQDVRLKRHEGNMVAEADDGQYETRPLLETCEPAGVECATCLAPIEVVGYERVDGSTSAAKGSTSAADALLDIHRYLFPERYSDVERGIGSDPEPNPDAEPYQWHAGTIEDVARMLEIALAGEPRARLAGDPRLDMDI
jgi:hypothetical protein